MKNTIKKKHLKTLNAFSLKAVAGASGVSGGGGQVDPQFAPIDPAFLKGQNKPN
ncbi:MULTISPECIES: hypothetical protein [Pseudoalteromonas]|uniref:Uncharacterized protein n=1 Tax=Pseudoalteromonas viridis TaxID=339617 RepID=A0ABX7VB53_9GAMM|nr:MULTISPECIES: hypothetical protein [Pseudoalteromonas]MCF2910397.1 hypothetical protein [Pseudoalteromonas sp. DL2-H2.2]QTL36425.1 hypothetical protein J5X90_05100 [Pseudoalteromonas viridis]